MHLRLVPPLPDPEGDPQIMHRRAMLASALGLTAAAAVPAWAEGATSTPDPDHTQADWSDAYGRTRTSLDNLAAHYVTETGLAQHNDICDSGLWLYAQAATLSKAAPRTHRRDARRLAAEAAAFAAGCYVDYGHDKAATDLYSAAHTAAGTDHPDLRTFIACQATWVPMYRGDWNGVRRRSETATRQAQAHGGPALLIAYTHSAQANAVYGRADAARADLDAAYSNTARVPGSDAPHTALTYTRVKVDFAAAQVYATLGDRDRHRGAYQAALEDPSLGHLDRQLMEVARHTLDRDPEHAARRIRFLLLDASNRGGITHCLASDARKAMGRLTAREITTSPNRATGPEVRALGRYLNNLDAA